MLLLSLAVAPAACGSHRNQPNESDAGGSAQDADVDLAVGGGPMGDLTAPVMAVVYAHSASELFEVDPATLAVRRIAAFRFAGGSDEITDIALDQAGNMIGVSFSSVYSIDKGSGACKRLSSIGQQFNGLSFVPVAQIDQGGTGDDVLVAADLNGDLTKIDPMSGKTTRIGSYGGGWVSSGDVVSVTGLGAYATVSGGLFGTDRLARIDFAKAGKATIIGDTGFSDVWGLAFWGDKLFGFSQGGDFLTIDVKTGKAKRVQGSPGSGQPWWGAGVATSALVTIQ